MDLENFIAETLVGIQHGVQQAIHQFDKNQLKGAINPVWVETELVGKNHVREVQFDIAVTVTEKSGEKGSAGIKVVGMAVGGDIHQSEENERVSRIQFSVPILPQYTPVRLK